MKINTVFTLFAALGNTILLLNLVGCSYLQRKVGIISGEWAIYPQEI